MRLPRPSLALPCLVAAALAAAGTGGTFAAFTSTASNPGNAVTAADDFRAPAVSASVIARSGGTVPGFVKQAGAYYVYATVAADTGNPASGIQSVTANVANVTTGSTAVSLAAGSFPAGGTTYNYRSASLTANASLSEGSKSYSVTATDNASNSETLSGLGVTVDNTPPSASDVQAPNTGGVGKAEQGDTLTFTFSEPIDPESIQTSWTGSATNVVVRLTDGGLFGNDDIQIRNAADNAALPFGLVDLRRGDYCCGVLGGTVNFGKTGAASTMSMSGNTLTLTLGNPVNGGVSTGATTGSTGAMDWLPSGTPYDRAGNTSSTATATESGSADKEF